MLREGPMIMNPEGLWKAAGDFDAGDLKGF
jgi:hypothetical protein